MTRIYCALFLSFTTATTYAMEKEETLKEMLEASAKANTPPNIAITPPNQITPRTGTTPLSTEKRPHPSFLRRSHKSISTNTNSTQPSTTATQSASSEESPQASPKAKGKKFSLALSNLSGSKESSPRNAFSSLLDSDPDKNHPLLHAVKENNLNKVTMLLNINTPDEDGNTPFIIAAKNGCKKIVREFLKQPTLNLNIQNKRLMTALHYAAREGHRKIVKMLLLDPRLDSSIKENNNFTAQNYLKLDDKCIDLTIELFGQITLDEFINREVSAIHKLITKDMLTADLTDKDLDLSVKMIKHNVADIAKQQNKEDRQLADKAILPEHANDDNIKKKLVWRLFYNNTIIMSPNKQNLLLQQSLTNNNQKNEQLSSVYL